jgi:hypothetical protein
MEKTLEVVASMFVDARIRAPWVLVERDRNENRNTVVLSHHETWAEARAHRAARLVNA